MPPCGQSAAQSAKAISASSADKAKAGGRLRKPHFALPSAAASPFPCDPVNEAALPPYTLIDQPGQLAPLLAALERVEECALDTEADNMFHYRTRVCLLQFLVSGEIFLVDALAPIDFQPLWSILATKHILIHGSDFDLRLLSDLCQFRPKSIFDTMLAAR